MPFDFNAWKAFVLNTADEAIDRLDLLIASGLVEDDDLEVAFEKLLDELQEETIKEKRRSDGGLEND